MHQNNREDDDLLLLLVETTFNRLYIRNLHPHLRLNVGVAHVKCAFATFRRFASFRKATLQNTMKLSWMTEIAHFRCIRSAVHEGPYYSVLGDNARVDKARRTAAAANVNVFKGMPTWSQRYTKRRRMLPRMDARNHGRSGLRSDGDVMADEEGISVEVLPEGTVVDSGSEGGVDEWRWCA